MKRGYVPLILLLAAVLLFGCGSQAMVSPTPSDANQPLQGPIQGPPLIASPEPTVQPVPTAPALPEYLNKEIPGIIECLSKTPNVVWADGTIQLVEGTTSGVQPSAFVQGITLTNVQIGLGYSPEEQAISLRKELCLTAMVEQTYYDKCVKGLQTPCMSTSAWAAYGDNEGVALLTIEEQKLFIVGTHIHHESPVWPLSCDDIKVYKEWHDAGITQGDPKELEKYFHPEGCSP